MKLSLPSGVHECTCAVQEVGHHGDVVHIRFGSGVEQHRPVNTSIVEEVKVDVLHKEPLRIPVQEINSDQLPSKDR